MLYNVDILLKELNISTKEKEDLIKELKDEFPQDDMLFEFHLYRAVQSLKKKGLNK